MLAHIAPLISGGVIDNTSRNLIELTLYCTDGGEPIELVMDGNCLSDIAGCRVSFTNRTCVTHLQGEHEVLRRLRNAPRSIVAGDITLSRREPEQDNRHALTNLLSIEFFVDRRLRIVVETGNFTYDLSLPQWDITWEEANAQQFLNMDALRAHVQDAIESFCGPSMAAIRHTNFPACRWDSLLNRAEAAMAIYPTIRAKYRYVANGHLSLAYVMGRHDLLAQNAAEDEAHMPPDFEEQNREWDVVDFFCPEHAQEVRRAMAHPLFQETSRLTGIIQQHLLPPQARTLKPETESFLNNYAGIVAQTLATILLTRESQFSLELANKRLQILSERIGQLASQPIPLPEAVLPLVREAAGALLARLEAFTARLNRP